MHDRRKSKRFKPILVLAVLVAMIIIGWLLFGRSNTGIKLGPLTLKPATEKSQLRLAEQSVTLSLPDNWVAAVDPGLCPLPAVTVLACTDGAAILPGEQLPTRFGDGEYFTIYAGVYDIAGAETPKAWFEQIYGGSHVVQGDQSTTEHLGTHDAYYLKERATTYESVWYVLFADDQAVLVSARTYEPGSLRDGSKVGDFRKFEDDIRNFAASLQTK